MSPDNANGINAQLMSLAATIARMDERAELRNEMAEARDANLAARAEATEAGIELIRQHQVEVGNRLCALEATSNSRLASCLLAGQAQDSRSTKISNELTSLTEMVLATRGIAEANRDELREQGSDLKEVSQVTMVSEMERAAVKAAWRRVGLTVWKYGWRALLALATLGLLGAGAVEAVRLLK